MSCCKSMFLLAAAFCTAFAACGCDQRPTATLPTTHPATRPVLPTQAEFMIDGRPVSFDSPRATLHRDSAPPRLMLYSETEGAVGSFYFELPVDADSLAGDGVIVWEQQLQQSEMQDSLVGMQLKQTNQTLQPQSLRIEVRPAREGLIDVTLAGEFFVYAADGIAKSTRCSVKAQFIAGIAEDQ